MSQLMLFLCTATRQHTPRFKLLPHKEDRVKKQHSHKPLGADYCALKPLRKFVQAVCA